MPKRSVVKLRIGCSGWNYDDWKGAFYPADFPKKDWLKYYAQKFNTVEVNGTFYNFPTEETLDSWAEQTPHDFGFSLKGSRYITHMKKLNDVKEPVDRFYAAANRLGDKLDAMLWQLPPNLHRDDEKLKDFCEVLDKRRNNAIEFRHDSWYHKSVYQLLGDYKVMCCSISSPEFPEEIIDTGASLYLRFHGSGKEWYNYNYNNYKLKSWVDKISAGRPEKVYAYFNNSIHGYAPANAMVFAELLKEVAR